MSSENSIVYQFVKKLGFYDNKQLIEKTNELLRRLETKSFAISKVSDNAKAVVCIDLASEMLNLEMDSKVLLRLSGFGKSDYVRNKRTFEKILDISQNFDIPKICIQLGISHVQKSAQQHYNDYTTYASQSEQDLTHPQYFAMAVYQACKKDKIKILKSKLIKLSHLKAQQWEKLEQSWTAVMDKSKAMKLTTKSVQESISNSEKDVVPNKLSQSHHKEQPINAVNNYNNWKTDLLKKSYNNLVETKSIDSIDIYILRLVLGLDKLEYENSKKLLKSYYQTIKMSVNTFDPKYPAMAVFQVLNKGVMERSKQDFLMEYSDLSCNQWNAFEKEWIANMGYSVDVDDVAHSMKHPEFEKWIVNFERI